MYHASNDAVPNWKTLAQDRGRWRELVEKAKTHRDVEPHKKKNKKYLTTLLAAGTATRYGLDGPGIESRWEGEIFRTSPDRLWGPPSLL